MMSHWTGNCRKIHSTKTYFGFNLSFLPEGLSPKLNCPFKLMAKMKKSTFDCVSDHDL